MSDLFPETKHKEIAACPILAMENAALERRITELEAQLAEATTLLQTARWVSNAYPEWPEEMAARRDALLEAMEAGDGH